MRSLCLLLAQSEPTSAEISRSLESWNMQDTMRLVTVVGILIAVLVVLGMILMYLRRRMLAPPSKLSGTGSLMEELRAMRASGQMSEAEYDAARKKVVAKLAAEEKGTADASPPARKREARSTSIGTAELRAPPGFDLTGKPLPKPKKS